MEWLYTSQPVRLRLSVSGLNRSMSRAGLSELHTFIEQACRLLGVAFCLVHAAGTSLTCHGRGAPGIRETQAGFYCPECDRRCNADLNAALNIRSSRWIGGRGGRRQPVGALPHITGTNQYGPVPS